MAAYKNLSQLSNWSAVFPTFYWIRDEEKLLDSVTTLGAGPPFNASELDSTIPLTDAAPPVPVRPADASVSQPAPGPGGASAAAGLAVVVPPSHPQPDDHWHSLGDKPKLLPATALDFTLNPRHRALSSTLRHQPWQSVAGSRRAHRTSPQPTCELQLSNRYEALSLQDSPPRERGPARRRVLSTQLAVALAAQLPASQLPAASGGARPLRAGRRDLDGQAREVDLALISHTHVALQELTNNLHEQGAKVGRRISQEKTKAMTAAQHQHLPPLTVGEQDIEFIEDFTYLGSNISISSQHLHWRRGEKRTDQNWQSCRSLPTTLEHLVIEIHHHNHKAMPLYVSGHPYSDLRLERPARVAIDWMPEGGKRRRGRPKKTWRQTAKEDLSEMGVSWHGARRVARDQSKWRGLIAQCSNRNRRN
ncbi:hypothetical protein Bbelb_242320 [Xyrichtys novacula]|uniref:Uncharacterized protein n=1 Tax=Xyrichtys novacula TaxID=13765 RepID=A0AAV1FZV9_XYRNO|nr:hypothetical protein Bbelb_242320 [Xyrichtys novacula]